MARILTRPLFRKGGLSQAPRPSYRGGGVMAIRPRYRNGGMNGIMSGIVPRTNAYAGYYNQETRLPTGVPVSSLEEAYKPEGFELWDWAKTKPEVIETPGGKTLTVAGGKEIETVPPDFVKMPLPTKEAEKPIVKNGKTLGQGTGVGTGTESDLDTIKSYMSMFQEALGEDQDDITRDKYLQLAQFGANLLAQPGGDLTGAIGKAAAPSIEGLGKIEARKRQADREIKLAAIKTAIDKMDDPTLDKIKSLAKAANMPIEEVAKSFVVTAQEGKTKESIITTNQEAMETEIGKGPALKAARTMAEAELNFALFDKLPVDKEGKVKPDTPNGYYYDEKGNLSIVKDGVKSDIKFKAKE